MIKLQQYECNIIHVVRNSYSCGVGNCNIDAILSGALLRCYVFLFY